MTKFNGQDLVKYSIHKFVGTKNVIVTIASINLVSINLANVNVFLLVPTVFAEPFTNWCNTKTCTF